MNNAELKKKLIDDVRIKNITLIEDFTDECIQRNCFDFGNADELLDEITKNVLSQVGEDWVSVDENGEPRGDYKEGYPLWCVDDNKEYDNIQTLFGVYSGGFEWYSWCDDGKVRINPTRYMYLPLRNKAEK